MSDRVVIDGDMSLTSTIDGEIGMYDLVNGVFYTNSGSGTFIKGEDV